MAKNTGKVREFCQSKKVGTLNNMYKWKVLGLSLCTYFLIPGGSTYLQGGRRGVQKYAERWRACQSKYHRQWRKRRWEGSIIVMSPAIHCYLQ